MSGSELYVQIFENFVTTCALFIDYVKKFTKLFLN